MDVLHTERVSRNHCFYSNTRLIRVMFQPRRTKPAIDYGDPYGYYWTCPYVNARFKKSNLNDTRLIL